MCTGINTAVGVVKKCTFPFLIQTVQHVPCLTKNGRKMDRPFRGFSYPIHSIRFRSVPFQNLRTSFTPHTHTPLVSLLVLTRWSPFLSLYTQFIGDQANSRCHYPLEHPLWHVPLHLYSTPDHSRRLCWLSPAESSTFVCMGDLMCLSRPLTHGRRMPLVSRTEQNGMYQNCRQITRNKMKQNRTYCSIERPFYGTESCTF